MEPSYLMTSFTVTPKPNIRFANLQNLQNIFSSCNKKYLGSGKDRISRCLLWKLIQYWHFRPFSKYFYLIPISDFISGNFWLKKFRPCLYIFCLLFFCFFLICPFCLFLNPIVLRPFFLILLILLQIFFASFIDPARSLQHVFNISLPGKNCISQKCKNIICSTCRAASHLFLWVCSNPALSCRLLWTSGFPTAQCTWQEQWWRIRVCESLIILVRSSLGWWTWL